MRTQRRPIHSRTRRQNHIADKLRTTRPIRARNHNRLRHIRVPNQRGLDLPRLNAEAANLDLMVRSPHKLQNPIPAPARQVPAAVHPAPRSAIPVRNKALPRQTPPTNIPPTYPRTRDVTRPTTTNRNRLQTAIQYINPRVPDWTTNWHACWKIVRLTTPIRGRPNTTLRWAFPIYQRNGRKELMVLDR